MIRVRGIKISAKKETDIDKLKEKTAKFLNISINKIKTIEISKKSIDARDIKNILFVFSVDIELKDTNEDKYLKNKNVSKVPEIKSFEYIIEKSDFKLKKRPVIVGFGPAGFMAGLVLAKAGLNPIIIEQGKTVEERQNDVQKFWNERKLNSISNIQFGEGGAGTFSDGKLTTGINSPFVNIVINEFIKNGAPEEIKYMAKPHIGTDKLIEMVKNIRNKIISLGGEIHFNSKLNDIIIKNGAIEGAIYIDNNDKDNKEYTIYTNNIILAIGHSARDTFYMLKKKGVAIEQKAFSIGIRIEHSQSFINNAIYGEYAKYLPAADYKLHRRLKNGRGAYTFCMCPGGFVVNAASEENSIVTNGMSYYKRDGKNSNSAILIGISPLDFNSDSPLAGIEYQRNLEEKAYILGGSNYNAPVQRVCDFLNGIKTTQFGEIIPTIKPGVECSDFRELFNEEIYKSLQEGIKEMNKLLEGFAYSDSMITAPETRSSSPVRIIRDDKMNSVSVKGLIPCGEGCGYAGGIVSAAVDGIKCALSLK